MFGVFDRSLFFWARDADHGVELWKSDGTSDGTTLLVLRRRRFAAAVPRC